MRALALSLFLVVVVVGCHKETITSAPGGPPSTAEADALWKLAPEGAMVGVVASPRALAMVEHGWKDIQTFIQSSPELAPAAEQLTAGLAKLEKLTGSADPSFASFGLSTTKGAAMFVIGPQDVVVVVPLGDRDKFLALAKGTKGDKLDTIKDGGTCKTTHGVYACAQSEAAIDKLGTGHMATGLATAHARGDLELVASGLPFSKLPIAMAIVAQLDRGTVTFRGTVSGLPKQILSQLGEASKPRTDGDRTTGFALAHVSPVLANAAAELADKPPIDGITPGDLIAAIGDPVTVTTRTDPPALDGRLPIKDAALFEKALRYCEQIPLGAKLVDGACRIPIPNSGLTIDVWVEGKELRVGSKGATGGASVPMSALGTELANNAWQLAFWGHGTAFAPFPPELAQQLHRMPMPELAQIGIRVLSALNEVGMAVRIDGDAIKFVLSVRTMWANPDDVVAKLVAIAPDDVLSGKGVALAKAIADGAPQSPFASDVKAGYSGMMAPMSIVGVVAAVAIPAFLDYMKKAKVPEASINLDRIGKSLKIYYAEHSAFPVGDTAFTPGGTCCGTPHNKCPSTPAMWSGDKIWSALDFQIDGPSMYQYRYHSDGKAVLVEARGDLDCDNAFATWTLDVKLDAGAPVVDLRRPPPGVY